MVANLASAFRLIFFSFFQDSIFLFYLLFATNYKADNHCMSSAASIESVFLNWMLSLVLFIFILAFLPVIYAL